MAAPTFVAEYEASSWSTTSTPKTVSVTTAVGDVLVVIALGENRLGTLATPTGGTGLTWTLRQEATATPASDWSTMYAWTATATTAETFTLSIARSGTAIAWGFVCLRYSGSSGIGATAKTNVSGGAPSLALTTTAADSAIVVGNSDWNAVDGASRVWRTVNGSAATEQAYFRGASTYAAYVGRHINAGTAGAKTVGLSAPSGQKYTIVGVEVLGTGSSTTTGTLSASTPDVTADLNGTVRITGTLGATAPLGTGDISGTVRVTGTLASTTPTPTADVTGAVTIAGTMAGTAPLGTASITGDVAGVVTGSLSATAPIPTADIDGTVTVTGTLNATSPLPLASFGGSTTVADAERVTPWTLAVTIDWQTLTVAAPSRTLTLDAPAPRTLDVATPPARTLELDAPAQTLTLTTPGWTLELDA